MSLEPKSIFNEYLKGAEFKSSLGNKGLYEQSKINERFYVGDQWYGAKCGNERPLVRHNIIKRIGDYKMSQVSATPISVEYGAEGIPNSVSSKPDINRIKEKLKKDGTLGFNGNVEVDEINMIMTALEKYRNVTARRVGFDSLCNSALKKSYISGSGIIYTYWDSSMSTGLYADEQKKTKIKGDICCEVLDVENVYFGDPYENNVQAQPYIIIASHQNAENVKREALLYGADERTVELIGHGADDGKILVLTRLYKEYKPDGSYTVKCVKVTENAIVRKSFDTRLRMYPLAMLRWEERSNLVYGESEVTYLVPNQIAINRMITANVWAAMSMGMPLMVVNGDTVTGEITNDPGQIIKIFGSNEDVAGAVKYVTPPDFCSNFGSSINDLIDNTLTQSGANEVALGDSRPDNAAALSTMRNAATMPLILIKNRYYDFLEQVSRIWADFWITQYGKREIRIEDESGVWFMPFDAARYINLALNARVKIRTESEYNSADSIAMLSDLYDKGIINKLQYLKRLPQGIIPDIDGLADEISEEGDTDDGV